jgi:hypothetical protein
VTTGCSTGEKRHNIIHLSKERKIRLMKLSFSSALVRPPGSDVVDYHVVGVGHIVSKLSSFLFADCYRFSAAWIAVNNASSLKGLSSKSTAPPARACRRSLSVARAVIKTIGIRLSAFARYRCSSKPSIPGIRTSRIRHLVSSTRLELRNSRADVKATTLKPKAPTRYRVESAIEASSSTMQTRGVAIGLAF